jgi:hypothetical protein
LAGFTVIPQTGSRWAEVEFETVIVVWFRRPYRDAVPRGSIDPPVKLAGYFQQSLRDLCDPDDKQLCGRARGRELLPRAFRKSCERQSFCVFDR